MGNVLGARKARDVLWVPIVTSDDGDTEGPPEAGGRETARVGEPRFWKPTAEQLAVLAGDFEEIMGTIALGGIDRLDGAKRALVASAAEGGNVEGPRLVGGRRRCVGGDGAARVRFEDAADGGVAQGSGGGALNVRA